MIDSCVLVDFHRVEVRASHNPSQRCAPGLRLERPRSQFLDPSVGFAPTYCTVSFPAHHALVFLS